MLGELVLSRLALSTIISRRRAVDPPRQHGLHHAVRRRQRAYDGRAAAAVAGRAGAAAAPPRRARRRRRPATPRPAPARREDAMGGTVAPLFYDQPLQIVSGEGPWLVAADGRRYLDAYNNVAVVGHADPTVVQRVEPAAGAAQHPLALPPPRGRRARRAAGGDDAARARHRPLHHVGHRGQRAGLAAGHRGDRRHGRAGRRALLPRHDAVDGRPQLQRVAAGTPARRRRHVPRAASTRATSASRATTDQVRAAARDARRPRPPPRAAAGRLRLHQRGRARRARDLLPGPARRRPRGGCALPRRRGADRLRPHRARALALRAVGRRARPGHARQADGRGLPGRARSSPGASSSTGSPSATTTSRPSPPPPRPRPPATRCSTCSRTGGSRSAPSSPAPTSSTGCATSRVRRTCWATCAAWASWPGSTSVDRPTARRLLEALVRHGALAGLTGPRRRRAQGAPAAGLGHLARRPLRRLPGRGAGRRQLEAAGIVTTTLPTLRPVSTYA